MAGPHPTNGSSPPVRDVKNIIFVGDSGIGKTTLIRRLLGLSIPSDGPDPVRYISEFEICDKFRVQVVDISASPSVESQRPDMYEFAHTVALCFAIDNPDSFHSACNAWFAETNRFVPGKPRRVLVGLKKDLRNDNPTIARLKQLNKSPVSTDMALSEKQRLGLNAYVECSTKSSVGMLEVFKTCLVNIHNSRE